MNLNKLRESSLVKNTFVLTSGTIAAQLIPILMQPILRRIFEAEDFGIYSIYLSIIGIVTVITSFRYENAIVLPKNESLSVNVFALSFFINAAFNVLLLMMIIIFCPFFRDLLKLTNSQALLLYLIPLSVFLFGIYQIINFWLIRQKAFRSSAINKISRRGAEAIGQFSFGYLLKFQFGLIWGDVIGNAANVISGFRQLKKTSFNIKVISKRKMKFAAVKFQDFPKFNLITNLLSAASFFLPTLFINKIYSKAVVGYFDLSKQVLALPLALVSLSISQVLLQNISSKYNNRLSIRNELNYLLMLLGGISILEITVIVLWGPSIFSFVFGDIWRISGEYSQIMVFSYALSFIAAPFSAVYIALRKLKILGIWQMTYFLGICSLLFIHNISVFNFLKYYVAVEVFFYLAYLILILFIIRKYEYNLKNAKL